MKRIFLRNLTIGTFVFFGVLAAIVVVWLMFPRTQAAPEDLLPADRTVLFLEIQKENDLVALSVWFPILREIPPSPLLAAAAVIDLGNGNRGWVTFHHPSGIAIAQYIVQTSSPEVRALLRPERNASSASPFTSLTRSSEFRSLQTGDGGTRLYLRLPSDLLPQPHVLQTTLPFSTPIHVRMTASGTSLTVGSAPASERDVLAPTIPLAFAHPILVLADVHPVATLIRLDSLSPASVSIPVQGWLRSMLRDLFGENLSPVHDLLPLLERKATIQIGRDEEGGPIKLLLEGTLDDQTEKVLVLLERHFLETLPLSDIRSRTFDEGMVFEDIRRSSSGSVQTTRTIGRWDIRETNDAASGRSFTVAVSDRNFIMSTSPRAVDAFVNETHGHMILPIHGPGRILGGGQANGSALLEFLTFFLPEGTGLPSVEGIYRWSVVEDRGRVTVNVAR